MPSNKDRLYVALFARKGAGGRAGEDRRYHWALIVAPKKESPENRGHQVHAKNTLRFIGDPPTANTDWRFEKIDLTAEPTTRLLVRVLVAKIENTGKLMTVFDEIPIRGDTEGWNCVAWVKDAVEAALESEGALSRRAPSWEAAHDAALWYVGTKYDEGRFDRSFDQIRVPTTDLLSSTEIID